MSSLGGSRGERNAKPKFSALDINSLYRTSRGESLEPSQQKNTVPRKHGMQSLGKVPSARRPPANLPSLKAETSSPSDTSISVNDSITSTTSGSSASPGLVNSQQQQLHSSNSSNNLSAQQQPNNNNNSQQFNTTSGPQQQQSDRNSNSTTWSAVTTGGTQPEAGQPPIYQSPQFQHEFPSLDGTIHSGSMKTQMQQVNATNVTQPQQLNHHSVGGGYSNTDSMSLRPQTEPSTWHQQQQANMSAGGRGSGGEGTNSNSQQPAPVLQVPPELKAVMPSFMYRSGGGITGGSSQTTQMGFGLPTSASGSNLQGQSYQQQQSQRSRSNQYANDHASTYQGRRSGNIPPRLQNQQQQRYEASPLIEPEAIVHRPIIRDEELERIENIAKDDGWAKDDAIDYNQKLNFSDDEIDPPPTAVKEQRVSTKAMDPPKEDKKLEEENKRLSWGREKERHDTRYEKDSRYPQNGVDRRTGSSTLDKEIIERVQQRREEEERRDMERRQAAAKKLQALEQKMHSKRTGQQSEDDGSQKQENDFNKIKTSNELSRNYMPRETRGDKEQYGRERYDKYDRENYSNRDRDGYSRNDRNADTRDRNFHSNLPPRFQRQQQSTSSPINRSDSQIQNERGGESYRSRTNFERSNTSGSSSGFQMTQSTGSRAQDSSTVSSTSDSKNIPFAQQYDPRFIHQNLNKQLQASKRRSDEMMQSSRGPPRDTKIESNRRRMDSEEDDRFSSGRESLGRSSQQQGGRKISVSSDDKCPVLSMDNKSDSRDRITSWVDELENDSRNDNKSDGYTEKQRQLMKSFDHGTAESEHPKQILQRSKTSVSDDSSSIANAATGNKQEDKTKEMGEKRSSESPKSWVDSLANTEEAAQDKFTKKVEMKDEPETDQKKHARTDLVSKSTESRNFSDDRRYDKGSRPRGERGGRYESRGSRGGYGSYRGNNTTNWNRRGRGSHMGHYRQDFYSESEGSECEEDYDPRRRDTRKSGKDSGKYSTQGREGFAPRGEPSRRGRGANSSSSQFSRRGPMQGNKRIDAYGPPNSKSPFNVGNDELKAEDNIERERKSSEHSTSDDKSKSRQNKNSELHRSDSNAKNKSHLAEDKKDGDEIKDIKPGSDAKSTTDKEKSPDAEKSFDRKTYGGVRKDDDRSYNSQYQRVVSQNRGKPKDERGTKTLSKPPGLSGKPNQMSQSQHTGSRIKTTSTSSVGSNSERENRGQRNTGKEVQSIRGPNKPPQSGNKLSNQNAGSIGQWDKRSSSSSLHQDTQQHLDKLDDARTISQTQPSPGMQTQTQPALNSDIKTGIGNTSSNTKTDSTKQLLDGTTPPLNTIIFENTNYKSTPVVQNSQQPQSAANQSVINANVNAKRADQPMPQRVPQKMHQSQDDIFKVISTSTSSISDIMEQQQRVQQVAQQQQHHQQAQQQSQEQVLSSALQGIDFNKADAEYDKDMKFSFTFGHDLSSQLASAAEAEKSAANKVLNKTSMHSSSSTTPNSSIISPSTAELNLKMQSVKKVWDVMPTVMEHTNADVNTEVAAAQLASNVASFQHQQHQLHQFTHPHANMSHVQHTLSSNATGFSNFGHDQSSLEHFSKSSEQTIGGATNNTADTDSSYITSTGQHSAVGQTQHTGHTQNIKHATEVLGTKANVCKVNPTQQQLQQASGLSGLSPPPQMQQNAMPAAPQSYYQAPSNYGMSAIPSPPAVVFNSSQPAGLYNPFQIEAGRSTYSQYPAHYGATGSTAYANYMQNMPAAATHEMYQSLSSQYRAMNAAPFNQSQQLNNPSTVLIASTSNTLMSASVKPSSQSIGTIGSKSGPPYGTQPYMGVYPQQGPPIQNSNYYSNTGGGQAGFFSTPTGGTTQNYGIQAGMFSGHGTAPTNPPPPQQYSSQYAMQSQMLGAAVTPQQYRGAQANQTNPQPNSGYIKQSTGGPTGAGSQSHTQSAGTATGMQDSIRKNIEAQSSQSSPPQYMKSYSSGNLWDLQNQYQIQQQLMTAVLMQQQYQPGRPASQPHHLSVPSHQYPTPIQRPEHDRMSRQSPRQYQQNLTGDQQKSHHDSSQQQYYNSSQGFSNKQESVDDGLKSGTKDESKSSN